MLSTSHDKRNALSQIHMQDNREHIAHSLSQPPTTHQTYAQYDSPAADHSSYNKTQVPTSQAKSTKHPISPHSTEQWQTINRKRYRQTEDHDYPTAKKTECWLGEAVPTSNRFSTLEEEIPTDDHAHSTDPKPPPIFISGVTNIKPLIELLNALAPNIYSKHYRMIK
jgi:hypothetical protein